VRQRKETEKATKRKELDKYAGREDEDICNVFFLTFIRREIIQTNVLKNEWLFSFV